MIINTEMRTDKVKQLINEADFILIGAGSGISTSAGIEYTGKRFQENFAEYIEKYHFTDMYSASFYEFDTEEEKWAYWAKHIYLNNIGMKATDTYKNILKLIDGKDYFVITTNVDEQFYKSGFDKEKIFATQGSYRMLQCAEACHNKLYDATDLVNKMLKSTKDLKIPTELVPKCPACGGKMEVNLRKDGFFVQDDNWYKQNEKYEEFLENTKNKKVVLLELGVGFNTPIIIRFPFEQMTMENENWNLIRINKENIATWFEIDDKSILLQADISDVIKSLIIS